MKKPKYLKNGSTIGLVAPSFGANIEPYHSRVKNAIEYFKQQGYKLKIFGDIFGYQNGASETKEKRAKHIMDAFTDNEVDLIWSVGGGELMIEILPLLDFDVLEKIEPKFFIGYSDNTNLTFPLNTLLNTISVYAPCFSSYGMDPLNPFLENTFKLLKGENIIQYASKFYEPEGHEKNDPIAPYSLTEKTNWINLNNEEEIILKGRLIGGCLDILIHHLGTPFDNTINYIEKYKNDNIIWFLDIAELNVFAYKRALWQLKQAGWFNNIKGLIVGRSFLTKEFADLNIYNVTKEIFSDYNIPIIMDIDIGHTKPMMTFYSGAKVEIKNNYKESYIKFDL